MSLVFPRGQKMGQLAAESSCRPKIVQTEARKILVCRHVERVLGGIISNIRQLLSCVRKAETIDPPACGLLPSS